MAAENPEVGSTVDAGGIATNYHDSGESEIPIVLLHGSGPGVSAWANWRQNIPMLSQEHRVIAPDIVGFGYTERPAGITYDLATWTDHLLAFLDALDLERVGLVGNSFGGGLTLAFAAKHPDRVSRFVLMGSVGLSFPATEALEFGWGYDEPSIENMRKLLELMAFNQELINDDLARMRHEASIRPGVQEAFSQMFPAPRQEALDALALDESAVAALPHEVLILHGRDDRIIPFEVSCRLLKLISRSQLHVFGNCGHWTQIEHADRFNRLVAAFFSEDGGS